MATLSDAEVIQRMREFLAARVSPTGLAALGVPAHMQAGWPEAPETAVVPASDFSPVNLNTLPDKPPVPRLLPILEEVQMENARVLPEIDQTLAQIEVSIGDIDQASVSLVPAPLQVPKIQETMTEAGDKVKKTLDEL